MCKKFSEVYQDTGGLRFVVEAEKEALIETGAEFPVLRVYRGEGQWGPKYNLVTVLPGEDEEKVMSFSAGSVDSRDRMLDRLIDFLEEEEDVEQVFFKLTRVKRSLILVDTSTTE